MSNQQLEPSNSQTNSGMSLADIALLIGFVGFYDLRVQVDEFKVRAWAESLDSDIPLDVAKKIVSAHYANHDSAINPSHINREWRHRIASERERERGRLMSLEIARAEQTKASPEVVEKYLSEIRRIISKGKDAPLETDNGQVASDS